MLFNTTRRPPDPKHEAHNHMDGDVSTDGAVYDNTSHEISHNRW